MAAGLHIFQPQLHGLNITYKCEICGGAEYKGPKMFQKHFQVWMRLPWQRLVI
jgi:splicing factor 3A subunit 3